MSTVEASVFKNPSSPTDQIVLNTDGSIAGDLGTTLASKLDFAGGKILQIVRVTDSSNRSTTSTSFVDITGMSVTITPQKNDSAILLIFTGAAGINSSNSQALGAVRLTDASDNTISGAQTGEVGDVRTTTIQPRTPMVLIGYSTPATTNATTYKARFRSFSSSTTLEINGAGMTTQLYAIEVSA